MSENIQDETIGNQQERPSEKELGWLAGIIDGEGSLSINCNTTGRSLEVKLQISSTSKLIIEECEKILKKIGVEYGAYYYVSPKGKEISPSHSIRIATAKRMKKILEVIKDYLIMKAIHSKIILEFCNSRLSLPYGYPYTEREMQLFYEIKKHQIKKGKPSKTGIPRDYTPGWRPRYKINNPRNIRYRKLKNIILPEDIVRP